MVGHMLRVLLILDDYGELLFMQTLLKKLGFDVDGIQNERNFEEAFLALNPEIVIATAHGKKVDGLSLAESIRRVRGFPKVILVASGPMLDRLRNLEGGSHDAILESPVAASRLLGTIATLASQHPSILLEKYSRLKATLSPEREADLQILKRDEGADPGPPPVSGGAAPVSPALDEEARLARFKRALEDPQKPKAQRFDRQRVHAFTKEIRAGEDPDKLAKLEAERQAFIKAMFKK